MPHTSHRVSRFTESVIRRMTRVAMECGAVNLSQGFPDFDPPGELRHALEIMQAGHRRFRHQKGQRSAGQRCDGGTSHARRPIHQEQFRPRSFRICRTDAEAPVAAARETAAAAVETA